MPRTRLPAWVALAVSLMVCLPGQVFAAEAAPCATTGVPLWQLLEAVPACQKDAHFLATLGQQLNTQGRYLEAADHLELALMLEPMLKDAQLSYAIALTGSSDFASATALLDTLLQDPTLPADLRTLIAQQKAALTEVAVANPSSWQSRFTLASRFGYDSNLLGAPNLSSLTLTLGGQSLELALDERYLARSGTYTRADAQLDMHRLAPDGTRWAAMASLRKRLSAPVPESGATLLDLVLERSRDKHNALGNYANVSAAVLESDTGMRYTGLGLAGGAAWQSAALGCHARLGVEWQDRSYIDNQVLSGRYTAVAGYWSCQQASGLQWLVSIKAGRDSAQEGNRPGGDQQQTSMRFTAYMPVPVWQRAGLLVDFEQSQQADATGYSPIIDNGATRTVLRRAARLEYQHPVSSNAHWVLGAEWVGQTSSLALFQQDSWGAYSGLRVNW